MLFARVHQRNLGTRQLLRARREAAGQPRRPGPRYHDTTAVLTGCAAWAWALCVARAAAAPRRQQLSQSGG